MGINLDCGTLPDGGYWQTLVGTNYDQIKHFIPSLPKFPMSEGAARDFYLQWLRLTDYPVMDNGFISCPHGDSRRCFTCYLHAHARVGGKWLDKVVEHVQELTEKGFVLRDGQWVESAFQELYYGMTSEESDRTGYDARVAKAIKTLKPFFEKHEAKAAT